MPELSTTTHQIQVPDSLEKTYVVSGCLLKAETAQAGHAIQCPECSIVPSSYPSKQTFEQWVALKVDTYCDAPEELADETLQVIGKEAPWREFSDLWCWDGKEATVHYFLAGVPTGLGPWFLFQAYCEADVVDTYRPLFKKIWQSLTWNGEPPVEPEAPPPSLLTALPDDEPLVELPPFAPPEEGPGFAFFDGREVGVSVDHCSVEVNKVLHGLRLELRLRPNDVRSFREDLVSEYASEEGFGFRFAFVGIHKMGLPFGEFVLTKSSSDDRRIQFSKDGWDYSVEFTGKLTLCKGWFGMTGFLERLYHDKPKTKLELYLQIDTESLDWSDYRFQSLNETEGAATETVRFLQIPDLNFKTLPDLVFSFKNLRELTIGPLYTYGPQRVEGARLKLDPRIGDFSFLETFAIHNCAISDISSSIGKLRNLKRLRIVDADLETTPPELWKLPALEHLCLSNNRLTLLPERVELPNLQFLDLENNALSTLPLSLLDSPKLSTLSLKNNPWESLDQRFLEVENLNFDLADRMRLFDYTYKGSDGSGQVPWDDSAFQLLSHSELYQQFEEKVHSAGHRKYLNALRAIAKRTLFFALTEEDDYSELGVTRFGGMPDLPKSLDYPRWEYQGEPYAYEFVAQLNCQELAPYQEYLPRSGMLYFFLNERESFQARVLYFEGPRSELIPGSKLKPDSYPLFDQFRERTDPLRAEVQLGWSLPSDYAAYCNLHYFPAEAKIFAEQDALLSGMSDDIQFAAAQEHHEINGYVFTQHESPELQASLAKRGNPEDWTVLLKLASIGGFQWWDAGEIFFVVHKSDLKMADFSNVYCGLESS